MSAQSDEMCVPVERSSVTPYIFVYRLPTPCQLTSVFADQTDQFDAVVIYEVPLSTIKREMESDSTTFIFVMCEQTNQTPKRSKVKLEQKKIQEI
jgi:hypothetical protein